MTLPAPLRQITDVLITNLEIVFDGLCVQRYGGSISLERAEPPPSSSPTARFRLHRADLPELHVDLEIRHVGGNVYDVKAIVDGGPSQTFTYCLPEVVPLVVPKAPHLAQEVASFLLDALERQLGSRLLRGGVQDRRALSSPDPLVSRPPSPIRP